MVLVRGHDTYSSLQITAKPATDDWGTIASTPAWLTVPILSESLIVKPSAFPKSQELGNIGAAGSISQGRQFVEGEFTVYPRYNSFWFWSLMANAMGGTEERTADESMDGQTVASAVFSTHAYAPQSYQCTTAGSESGVAGGLSMRVWKSGESATAGYIDTFAGATITGFTWNQPEDDLATVTFRVLATAPTTASASAGTWNAAQTSHQVKVRDLSNTGYSFAPSVFKMGKAGATILTTQNVRSFSITLDGNYEIAPAALTSPDSVSKPGHTDGWSVTGEVVGLIEQGLAGSTWPYKDFVDGTDSGLHVRYASSVTCDASVSQVYYGLELRLPLINLTTGEATTAGGGANATRFGFEAFRGPMQSSSVSAAADNWSVPLMIQTHLSDTDDGSSTVLAAADGGNDLNADMDL